MAYNQEQFKNPEKTWEPNKSVNDKYASKEIEIKALRFHQMHMQFPKLIAEEEQVHYKIHWLKREPASNLTK